MSAQETSLILDGVSKKFPQRDGQGEFIAVDNVSLEIKKGEFLTLLGPSGCGKTTTLRLIAGFESPTIGKLFLDGKDITTQPPNKRDMTMVFQSYALFPHMTVQENVAYGLQIQRVPRSYVTSRVNDALEMMGLSALAKRRPNQLSGGQQQRVALARALIMEPSVLLFDEPLSNLDAKLRVQMRGEIHRLQRRLSITSVYVTHDQEEAMALSDRVVVMNLGKIEQIGSPEDIYRYPKTRFVADFIGRANFANVTIQAVEGDYVIFDLFGRKVRLHKRDEVYQVGETVTAMLRPEAVRLRSDSSLQQVYIEQAMYLGSEVEYTVNLEPDLWVIADNDPSAHRAFNEGDMVGIDFVDEAVHLLKI